LTAQRVYEKFILNEGDIQIYDKCITVNIEKKRNLPLILENMSQFENVQFGWLNGKNIKFQGATYS